MSYILNDDFNGGTWVDANGVTHSGSSGVPGSFPSTSIWTVKNGAAGSNFGQGVEEYVKNASIIFQDGSSNLSFYVGKLGTDGANSTSYPSGRCDTGVPNTTQDGTNSGGGTPNYVVSPGNSVEIKAKIFPLAGSPNSGAWPACWLLGLSAGPYPSNWAEIDMQESGDPNINSSNYTIYDLDANAIYTSPGFPVNDGNYHIWRVDYNGSSLVLNIDGSPVHTVQSSAAGSGLWPYQTQMFVILNVAVGGTTPQNYGTPAASSLPAHVMDVDYVRIWAPAGPDPNTGTGPASITSNGSIAIKKPALAGTVASTAAGTFIASGGLQVKKPSMNGAGNTGTGGSGAGQMGSLTDAFGADDTATNWANSYGTFSVAEGHFLLQSDASYSSGLASTNTYDLTASYAFLQAIPYAPAGNSNQTALQLYADDSNLIVIQYSAGTISGLIRQAGVETDGPSVTYDPVNHAWWRIREASGTIFFEASPDASTWTQIWSTTYTMTITALSLTAYAGSFGADATGTSYLTNINVIPSPMSALVDGFDSDDLSTTWAWSTGTVSVSGSECSIQADSSYDSTIISSVTYNLLSSSLAAEVLPYIAATAETGLNVFDSDGETGNYAKIYYLGGQLNTEIGLALNPTASGPSITYDPVNHAWWRIRESSGTLFFETSPDSSTWAVVWSTPYSFNVSALEAQVYAGDGASDGTGTSNVTNVNVSGIVCSGSLAIKKPQLSGATGASTTSTGSIAVKKPSLSGTALVVNPITTVGTPTLTRATSGSVTPVFGSGQVDTAGDLLVAVVTAAAATSVTAPSTPAGWTLIDGVGNSATAHAYVAMYYKIAVGSDSLPAFTSTLSGTGAMTATVYELNSANSFNPIDIYGTYASGSSAITVAPSASATLGTRADFAIGAHVMNRAAATNTWTSGGTNGFSNSVNDGSTNSVAHTAIDLSSAHTGAITSSGTWTTETTAFAAGLIVGFLPAFTPGAASFTLTDSFGSNDLSTLWGNSFGTVTVSGGVANVKTDTAYDSALVSSNYYDIRGNYAFANVVPYTSTGLSDVYLAAYLDANNYAIIQYFHGNMTAALVQEGVSTTGSSVTYNATNHAYWRITESSGTLSFDTSPDTQTWTNLWSNAYTIDMSAVQIAVFAGDDSTGGTLTDTAGPAFATSTTNTVTTAAFSPASGDLLVALASWGNGNGAVKTSLAVTDNSGSGSWTLLSDGSANASGYAQVWIRDTWGATSHTVTATASPSTITGTTLEVRRFSGAKAAASQSGVTAVSSNVSDQNLSITPGTTGSQVVGAFATDSGAKALTANATTTIYGQYDGDPNGSSSAAVKASSTSTASTPISIGFTNTAAVNTFALAEILAATPVSGTSTVDNVSTFLAVTCSGSLAIKKPSMAGTGGEGLTFASGSAAIKKPSLSGAGHVANPTAFPQVPLSLKVEVLINGTWEDITSYVYGRDAISITRGRQDEASTIQPGQMILTLNNRDGRFSPRNPNGAYYPNLTRNTQVRLSAPTDVLQLQPKAYRFWGEVPAWPPAWDPTGTDVYVQIQVSGVTRRLGQSGAATLDAPLNRYYQSLTGASAPVAYWPCDDAEGATSFVSGVPGVLPMAISGTPDLSSDTSFGGTLPLPQINGSTWTGVLGAASFGSQKGTASFTTSGNWTCPQGVNLVTAYVVAGGGGGQGGGTAAGRVGGGGGESATETVGVTPGVSYPIVIGGGGIGGLEPAGAGGVGGESSFTGDAVTVMANPGQGGSGDNPGQGGTGSTNVAHFDGGDGGASSTHIEGSGGGSSAGNTQKGNNGAAANGQGASPGGNAPSGGGDGGAGGIGTGTNRFGQIGVRPGGGGGGGGTQNPVQNNYGGGGAAGLCQLNWTVPVFQGSGGPTVQSNVIQFLVSVPAGGESVPSIDTVLCRAYTNGTVAQVDLRYQNSFAGTLSIAGYNSAGTQLFASPTVGFSMNGNPYLINFALDQNGANVNYSISSISPADQQVQLAFGGTYSSGTVGTVAQVVVNPGADLVDTSIGQIAVFNVLGSTTSAAFAASGYDGEDAATRFARLCGENGVAPEIMGSNNDAVIMGPQGEDTLMNLLQTCEDADRGQIYEPRTFFGLGYRTRANMSNQAATAALNYAAGQLADPLAPTDDDLLIVNDVTVERSNGSISGSSYELAQTTGPLSTANPPDGVGAYEQQYSINLHSDLQLADEAGWILSIGTVDQQRFPAINVDLTRPECGGVFGSVASVDVGDLVTISSPPAWMPPETIQQLAVGWQETLNAYQWSITWNNVPALPYFTGVVEDSSYSRTDTDGSTLTSSVSSTATSISVTTETGFPAWTTNSADLPFDIYISGERMTVTAISGSSSPQTFTVMRSVNGVAKAQSAGTSLQLFYGTVIAL